MVKTRRRSFVAAAFLAFGVTLLAGDPNIGTWKLNPAKSKFSPGPAPKSQTLTIERGENVVVAKDGKTRTLTQTGKNAHGQAINNVLVFEKQ